MGRPAAPESRQIHLDVRAEIQEGREPFARIMAAADALAPDEVLVLRAPFEPRPLYTVLGRRGLAHWTERRADDDWLVWFHRSGEVSAASGVDAPAPRTLDVRGLEPPEPMVRVLAALDSVGADTTLEVIHDRRPLFLYPQLDERGFVHETDEPASGVVRIRIHRKSPP